MSFQKVYENLAKGPSDLVSVFGRKPVPESGKAGDKPEWLMCGLWKNMVLKEWQSHQQTGSKLCTKMSIGRLLGQAIQQVDVDQFKLVERMNWDRDFVLVDIVGVTLGICGTKKYLRVQQTPTADDPANGKSWDMVIFPECNDIVTEMTKLHSLGIRSSVAIWNAFVTRYRKPWSDGKDTILGEIFLRNNYAERNVLTVVIFQHENVAEALIRYYAGGLLLNPNVNGNIRRYHQSCDGPRAEDEHLAIFSAKFVDNEDDKDRAQELSSDDESWEFVGATEPNTPEGSEVSVDVLVGAAEQPYFIVREPLEVQTENNV